MPGDYSRFRFDPLRNYLGVRSQQGRVVLDSDFNEAADIVDRRQRAEVLDIMGRARVSRVTPDAFRLTVQHGTLAIGKGRMYVDGLLAENHGVPESKAAFDDALEGVVHTGATSLQHQPYPPAIQLPTSGKYLVYLDVWKREVTRLESPDLVESAVGVDTSTRGQTVWQVRLFNLTDSPAVSCSTPDADIPGGWSHLISPSTGRLTTDTFEMPPADDPCELPPTGGYRGLENQLYRVQIHDGGQPGVAGQQGGATFKWSRENASVEFLVTDIASDKELELESLGRDAVLRLEEGDWVEILDDRREFSLAPGEMHRITTITDRRITLNGAVTSNSGLLGSDFDKQHLRVRRWDQNEKVFRTGPNGTTAVWHDLNAATTTGAIPVPQAGTKLLLEQGISVSFDVDPNTSGFRSGDYWLFAARTADASVERVQDAPPLGIHHHYARLGIWTVGGVGVGSVTDCRQPWPDSATDAHDCGCTVCVTEESHRHGVLTIQKAVDQVRAAGGGTVCLGPGMFPVKPPIELVKASHVRIIGQGRATVLGGDAIFLVQRCEDVSIEDLTIQCDGQNSAVSVSSAWGLSLQGLHIESSAVDAAAISLSGVLANVRIRENKIGAPRGIASDPKAAPEQPPLSGSLDIEHNLFFCKQRAISLTGERCWLRETRIADNQFVDCTEIAVEVVGLAGSSHVVRGNTLKVRGPGIRCAGGVIRVSDNELEHADPKAVALARHIGIDVSRHSDDPGPDDVESCQLLANQVKGFFVGISFGSVAHMLVRLNMVSACRTGIQAIAARRGDVSVENNHLFDIGQVDLADEGASAESVFGIAVAGADSCTIAGNTIHDFGAATKANSRAAIATFGAQRVQVNGNDLFAIAPGPIAGSCAGILIMAPYDDFLISHNRVSRDAGQPGPADTADWSALKCAARKLPVDGLATAQPTSVMLRVDPTRVLVFGGDRPYLADFSEANEVGTGPTFARGARGSIVGNAFNARGGSPAVDVASISECLFNDNRVELSGQRVPVVLAAGGAAIASANRVRGGSVDVSLDLHGSAITALGNITRARIHVNGAVLLAPWDAMNISNA